MTATSSAAALPTEEIASAGVRIRPDIGAITARKDHEVEIFMWNYHDDDIPAAATAIDLVITRLPEAASRGRLEHFRVDVDNSNAFTVWKKMGGSQSPTPAQYEQLTKCRTVATSYPA